MPEWKTVPVTMPTPVWGRLATIADGREVRVADLVADAVERLVEGELMHVGRPAANVSPELRARLAELCAAGLGVEAISHEVGRGANQVRRMLTRCGLQTVTQRRNQSRRSA